VNIQPFQKDGYQIFKSFLDVERVALLRAAADSALQPLLAPVEYEADTGYPGAPLDRRSAGGQTPRRLLAAYARSPLWRALATDPELKKLLSAVLKPTADDSGNAPASQPQLSQSHHNCIMTKHPGFSSKTLWHQDIRYWAFSEPELVSAWFALTAEHEANGGLWLIPGSHRLVLEPERFDAQLFLRTDLPENQTLIDRAVPVSLNAGDLLLFHCRTFHAASTNDTEQVKLSAVFTYHNENNAPLPDSRSALYPSVPL